MSKYYDLQNLPDGKPWQSHAVFGKARNHQPFNDLKNHFAQETLYYLSEQIINHLADSINLDNLWREQFKERFNDFSFFTAPAYKAFEGFLFQLGSDLHLPSSGDPKFVGTYFDEEKVDKTIDKLLKELESKAETEKRLSKQERIHVKDMVNEMKRFLYHYRHTPAHFHGEPMNTIEKARQNVMSMYRIIDETTKTLLRAGLIQIRDAIF